MRTPGLRLSLPSDMSDAFCTILDEYAIQHSLAEEKNNGPKLAVNSAQDSMKEIVIELINSGPFWAAFSACFIAYLNLSGPFSAAHASAHPSPAFVLPSP